MADTAEAVRVRVPLGLSIPRVLTAAGYRVESAPAHRQRVELHDTGDRRLAAAGAEAWLHPRDGWTWRRTPSGHPKLATRDWTAGGDARDAVLRWSRAYRRGRPLAARAVVAVQRRTHRVGGEVSGPLVVAEERADEQRDGRWAAVARHAVVAGDDRGAAVAVATLLAEDRADVVTLAAVRPSAVRGPRLVITDTPDTGAGALLVRSLTASALQWLYFDCEVAEDSSPVALRKVRVALRRLRSDLQTFRPLLDRAWAESLREDLGAIATALGRARDAEVLCERLTAAVAELPPADRDRCAPLLDRAFAEMAAARSAVRADVEAGAYLAALDRTVAAIAAPAWVDGDDDAPVTRLARRPWRRLRDHVAAMDASDPAQLHRMRILAKRARYAADACVPAAGEPAAGCAQRLADVQTVLGEHHDASVARDWLERQAREAPELAFPAGELAAHEGARMREAGSRWRDAWRAASRRRDWRWLRS